MDGFRKRNHRVRQDSHYYSTVQSGISLTALLRHGPESVECEARLDTGSRHCIFKRAHGELLGLDIESTVAENIGTVSGLFKAQLHTVTIEVLGIRSAATVFRGGSAIHEERFRKSWLARPRQVSLIDHED